MNGNFYALRVWRRGDGKGTVWYFDSFTEAHEAWARARESRHVRTDPMYIVDSVPTNDFVSDASELQRWLKPWVGIALQRCPNKGDYKMTRTDYELIAGAIRHSRITGPAMTSAATEQWVGTAEWIAAAFAEANPRFNRARFLAACGVEEQA